MAGKWGLFFNCVQSALTQLALKRLPRSLRTPVLIGLCLLTLVLCLSAPTIAHRANPATPSAVQPPGAIAQGLVEQGQQFYQTGRYQDAVQVLQQAIQQYEQASDLLGQAIALSNLSLTYQQLGQWAAARSASETSLALLRSLPFDTSRSVGVLAQALTIQGRLQSALGEAEQAYTTWEEAVTLYQSVNNTTGVLESRINQAQALRSLGFYGRAVDLLEAQVKVLQAQPNSLTRAIALRSLGEAFRVSRNLAQAQIQLEASLAIATTLGNADALADAQLSLGNLKQDEASFMAESNAVVDDVRDKRIAALKDYQQAALTTPSPNVKIQAQLNQLKLLIALAQLPEEEALTLEQQAEERALSLARWTEAQTLWTQIRPQLANLSPSRTTVYYRIDLADSGMQLRRQATTQEFALSPSSQAIADVLVQAVQFGRELGDQQAQSYAMGTLGELYEQTEQWAAAKSLTLDALSLAQAINAPDIAYRWQWQLGRILRQLGDRHGAIADYEAAVKTLQGLRADLVASSLDAKLSFRGSVEPIHREFVSLLLALDVIPTPDELEKARGAIESLQLAELDNYLRAACADVQQVKIDEIDPQAAVIYPIALRDRLEVIVKLPNQPLSRFTPSSELPITQAKFEETVKRLLTEIGRADGGNRNRYLPAAQQLYDWLIRPIEANLVERYVKTLAFVPSGTLRSLSMSVLHDGEQFLIEKGYSVAVTPSLTLLPPQPQPQTRQQLRILLAGSAEFPQSSNRPSQLRPLFYVNKELEDLRSLIPRSQILQGKDFTYTNLRTALRTKSFPIVHLATHGEFGTTLENTYIATWDRNMTIEQLRSLLQDTELRQPDALELLVMSACKTAVGNDRAALGLAGTAVRSGARTTVATLWYVDDESSAELMNHFYEELFNPEEIMTKAEALRRAQLALLQNQRYSRPFYWAPYVLIGNWQ